MLHVPFIDELHLTSDRASDPTHVNPLEALVVVAGRMCFAAIFILGGLGHFLNYSGEVAYAQSMGVPMADLLVPVAGAMILIGGLSVLLGYWARLGALLIVAFLVPVTLIMHRFWGLTDAMQAANQTAHFLKNVSMLGGALLVMYFGPGPFSLDRETDTTIPRMP